MLNTLLWMDLFFLDVIGLIIGMSAGMEYIRDGKITKMIVIELSDERFEYCPECNFFQFFVVKLVLFLTS